MLPERGRERCLLCGGAALVWAERPGRQLLSCAACGFAWVPQGVALARDGATIYSSDQPIFFTDEQRDYYRDDVTIDAARAKVEWMRRFVPKGASLLDVGANFGHFL